MKKLKSPEKREVLTEIMQWVKKPCCLMETK